MKANITIEINGFPFEAVVTYENDDRGIFGSCVSDITKLVACINKSGPTDVSFMLENELLYGDIEFLIMECGDE